jgi:ATP-binding cassette, subfamily B, multidrug efflux pump
VKHLFTLNKFLYKYRYRLLLGILFVSLSNYFRVLQPQMIREALDLVSEKISQYNVLEPGPERDALLSSISGDLLYFGLLVLGLAILMGIFMYYMRQTIVVMSRLIEYDQRKELFQKYASLSQAFYRRNNTGDLMSRITEDVSKVRMYLGPALLYGINMVSLFVLTIWSMVRVDLTLTLYTLIPLPILSLSIYYVSKIINQKSTAIQQQLASLNSLAQEVYSGIRIVKTYIQEKAFVKYFDKECVDYKDKSLSLAKVNALFFPLMLLLIGVSTILTIYIGGLQVAAGKVTPGNIAEFVLYVNMLTWPMASLGWIASIVQQAEASQERINEFLATVPEVANESKADQPLAGHIAFEDVYFTYPDTGIQAIRGLSFDIPAGQRLAIVGRTASGKSTIADLMLRMYDPNSGRITIDGEDLRNQDLDNLRKRIGYVPQDVFLFSDSIHGNISFGKTTASRQEVEAYAGYAAVKEDIMGLPHGFDTLVGERGVTLSGGQKQRVSIARALLKDPDILILDDCLSAVDTRTEQQILNYFQNNLKNKTIVLITHRVNQLIDFDKIIVIDKGQMVEEGTHESLLAQKGVYFELFEQQKIQGEESAW